MGSRKKSEILALNEDAIYQLAKSGEFRVAGAASMTKSELQNAVLAQLAQRKELIDDSAASASIMPKPATGAPVVAAAAPIGKVTVSHGSYLGEFANMIGMTVAHAISSVRDAYSVDDNPRVFLNGDELVNMQHVLQAGDKLEITKRTSTKGQ